MLVKLDGEKVIAARAATGLTRDELAAQSGVSRVTLYMVENDRLKLGCQLHLAEKLAANLATTVELLQAQPPERQRRPDLQKS